VKTLAGVEPTVAEKATISTAPHGANNGEAEIVVTTKLPVAPGNLNFMLATVGVEVRQLVPSGCWGLQTNPIAASPAGVAV
jgi:hypothetical protein